MFCNALHRSFYSELIYRRKFQSSFHLISCILYNILYGSKIYMTFNIDLDYTRHEYRSMLKFYNEIHEAAFLVLLNFSPVVGISPRRL